MNHYGLKLIFTASFFVLVSACRPDPIYETVLIPALPPESAGSFSLQTELIGTLTGVFHESHGVTAFQSDGDIIVLSPWLSDEYRISGRLQGVLSVENNPLLFTDDGVFWLQENAFTLSPFSDLWTDVFLDGYSDATGFWLQSEERLYRYSDTELSRIDIGDEISSSIGFGATVEGYSALWFATDNGLHQLVDAPAGAAVSHSVG